MLEFMRGAVKSNTIQVNGILVAIWTALYQSTWVQENPETLAIFGGIQSLVNLFLRAKTKKPLAERAD